MRKNLTNQERQNSLSAPLQKPIFKVFDDFCGKDSQLIRRFF